MPARALFAVQFASFREFAFFSHLICVAPKLSVSSESSH